MIPVQHYFFASFIWKWKLYITRERKKGIIEGFIRNFFFLSHLAFAMNINLLLSNIIYEKVLALNSLSIPSFFFSFLMKWFFSIRYFSSLTCTKAPVLYIYWNLPNWYKLLISIYRVFFLFFAKLFLVICDCSIKEVWDEIIASHFLWEFNFLWVN